MATDYAKELYKIIDECKGEYIKDLNVEREIHGVLPQISFDGLKQIEGLTLTKSGDLAAVLIALNDEKVRNAVFGFFESNTDVREALYRWGKLQEDRVIEE